MKFFVKILKLFTIIVIFVSVLLFSASLLLQDRVADIVLKSINKNISTKLAVGSVRLSFLRKFPKASLQLRNVLVSSSPGFNAESFHPANTDTLLAARVVSVEFRLTDIINGIYNIESISASSGRLNLFSDSAGHVNYDISVKGEKNNNDVFTIDLQKIVLDDINTTYNNVATKLYINGLLKGGRLKSKIAGDDIDFSAVADIDLDSLQIYNTSIAHLAAIEVDLNLRSSRDTILFNKGTLKIEDYSFGLTGSITNQENIDLKIYGNNIDISKIRSYIPDKYQDLVSEYNPSGIMTLECMVTGSITRTSNPHLEISAQLNSGQVTYKKSDLTIRNLSFEGLYSNGSGNEPSTSVLKFRDIRAKLGSSDYSGELLVKNLEHPWSEGQIKGRVLPEEIKEFFNISKITTAGGSVDLDLKLSGYFKNEGKFTLTDFFEMKPEATLLFNKFDIGVNNNQHLVTSINGKLALSKIVEATDFHFNYKGQNIIINGSFTNLPEWLSGKAVQMIAKGDIIFDKLKPEAFFREKPTEEQENRSALSSYNLPDDLILDISFKIDSLSYKSFSSSNMFGTLTYKPRLLTFNSLNMLSLNGSIAGNGFIIQKNTKDIIARANFKVSDINVNKAFTVFKNFGQEFLKAENISGELSGEFSFLLPMDTLLNPNIPALTAEGKYQLINGALKDFDPVKQLSKFIELSELENIRFEKLENDFFIRENFLYIPQMDVRSSAADLTVNGKHSFENNYEYHVKVLLSEILSRKRKNSKNNVTEFGAVEDDGLGRTSLLLKLESKGDDVKVGYDIKAAGNEIKTNIKSERQTLKSILNQEYGWFKGDTTANPRPAEKTRFRISWDDSDSLKTTIDSSSVKKQGLLKNLIKKK